jgi:hypothetical protein
MKIEEIPVEHKVPVPTDRTKIEKPWCDMVPGSTFFVAFPDEADTDTKFKLKRSLTAKAAKKFGTGNYSIRVVEHEGHMGVRVWRRA